MDATPLTADRRATRARRFALACSLLLFAALGVTNTARPAATPPVLDEPRLLDAWTASPIVDAAPASIEELRGRIAAVLEREGVPGVGLALVDRDGVRWAGGVGVADLESRRPVDADTLFRVGSITKSVVALGVMRLVEEGRLDLDRPLRDLMPDVAMTNAWDASAPITLAHALEHTAGFDDMRFNEWYGEEGMRPRAALSINPRSRVARWRPGSRVSYSNPGYTVAAHALELATGEPYDAWLEREVLRPLGMATAGFRRTPERADRLATGYAGRDRPAAYHALAHGPAGGLLASPREMAALVRFWVTRGQVDGAPVVGEDSLARIERTGTLPYPGTDTNYGLGNYGDVMHRVRSRGHDGGLPGFLSSYRYFPGQGVGYVMLLNSTHSVRAYLEIRALLFAYLTRGRSLPEPPTAEPDPEEIAAATAYYGYANPRMELIGFVERAVLGIRVRPDPRGVELEFLTGGELRLVPTGDGGFRLPQESGTSVRLTADAEGRRIVNAGMAYFEAASYGWARARLLALQGALLLIQLAPVWALGFLSLSVVRRLRGRRPAPGELSLHLWPAAASLLLMAIPMLLGYAIEHDAAATANPLSVGLWLCTLAFAVCSTVAFAESARAAFGPGGLRLARIVPCAASLACFGMALYLFAHGIVGLRTWAW